MSLRLLFAFTGETPSDGMVITERPDPAQVGSLIELLTSPRSPTVLREACNVLRFERAEPDAYGLLRSERPAAARG